MAGNKKSNAPGFGSGNGKLKKVGGLKKSKSALKSYIPKQFRRVS